MWLSISKRIFNIGSVDPEIKTSQTLPLNNIISIYYKVGTRN